MGIEIFDATTVKPFINKLIEAVKVVCAEEGIDFQLGRASVEPTSLMIPVIFETPKADEIKKQIAKKTFELLAKEFGLSGEDYERSFVLGLRKKHTYKVVGIRPRCRKFPVITISEDGKEKRFSVKAASEALKQLSLEFEPTQES